MDTLTKMIGRTIRQLRKAKDWNQTDLAERAEVDQGGLSKLETGRQGVSIEALESITRALGLSVAEFMQLVDDASPAPAAPVRDLESVRLPVISWVQAGTWADSGDSYTKQTADEWVTTHSKVGRRAFALRVRGDSMTNPRGEPSFPAGTLIVVDPSRQAGDGSLIVIRADRAPEATFKRLQIEGGQSLLVPLNPQFPVMPVPSDSVVCGVVVAKAEMPL